MRMIVGLLLLMPSLAMAHAYQVVPFHLAKNDLVEINVVVNGKAIKGLLDSGTGAVLVSRAFASASGLVGGKAATQASGGGEKPQLLFPVRLTRVSFGSATLRNVSGFATDLRPLSADAGFPISVLLGYPFFENHVVTINYPKQQIRIYGKGQAPACPSPIPITIRDNVPVVTAQAMLPTAHLEQTVHLIVDLGTAKAAAMFGEEFLNTDIGKAIDAHKHARVGGNGLGGAMSSIKTVLPELKIGSQRFYNLPVGTTSEVKALNGKYVNGSLGVLLWRSGSITFDYPGRTLCIRPGHV